MMKIVLAPNAFKEALPAAEAARAMARGFRRALPHAQLLELPVADGGDGTAEILRRALGGKARRCKITGPLGRPAEAELIRLGGQETPTDVVEVAQTSGLKLVPPSKRNPLRTSTRGLGEMIEIARRRRTRRLIIGLGGSATVDGGTGMAAALGLLGAMLFGRWHKGLDNGATGDFHFGNAVSAAFFAFWPTLITGTFIVKHPSIKGLLMPEVAFYTAMIGAVAALVVHALGWWLAPSQIPSGEDDTGSGSGGDGNQPQYAQGPPAAPSSPWDVTQTSVPATPPQAPPAFMSGRDQMSPLPGSIVDPKLRWGATRALFAVLSFMLMGGSIVTAVIPIAGSGMHHDDVTGFIIASIASFSLMIFALRKTTPVKRIGFWRESVRPFFQSIALFVMGGSVVGITRHWDCGDEARIASIAGLVFGFMFFNAVSLIGRKPPKPRNFIRQDDSSYAAAPPEPSDVGQPANPPA
ncbi:glycerate kinase [Candidatus Sumerlaeota bacterium]|nr:glycerate kinase [Candidatus Sumerlaeota bacterium]